MVRVSPTVTRELAGALHVPDVGEEHSIEICFRFRTGLKPYSSRPSNLEAAVACDAHDYGPCWLYAGRGGGKVREPRGARAR